MSSDQPPGRVRDVLARLAPAVIVFVVLLIAWLAATELLKVPAYLLPSPQRLLDELSDVPLFVRHGAVTLVEAVIGFCLATIVGVLLAMVIDYSRFAERAITPYLIVATNIPIVAFAPIVVIYFGFGMESKVVVAAFVTFFPIVIHTSRGLRSADPVQRDIFFAHSASRWQTLRLLKFPSALPYLFAALKIAATASVLAAVVAEFIQASQGLGWLILTSAYVSDITRVWATVVVSSMVAIAFYAVIALIERRVIPWHSSMR